MAARRVLKGVLVDLSGTLHIEDSAVPGAQEALNRLRKAPVTIRFVTNTTKECKEDLLARLKTLEFDIREDEIFTSLTAARNLVEQKQVRPLLLVEDNALRDFRGINTNEPNAVVIGLAPDHFSYQMMNQAFRLILDGAPLIAIHKARYYKRKDGLALGPGPFVTGLEYATDVKATVVGKPEKTFFLEALRGTNCAPEETVMIGDDCRDDVGGAQNAGMLGILVKTGGTLEKPQMATKSEKAIRMVCQPHTNTGEAEPKDKSDGGSPQTIAVEIHALHKYTEPGLSLSAWNKMRYLEDYELGVPEKAGKYREADEGKINPPPYLICESFPQAVDHILQHML